MKRTRYNKLIGLMLAERSILAAEVADGEKPAVRAVGVFDLPDGVAVDDGAAVGTALGTFLRARGFTARAAVVGLPAKWLVMKPRELPPADEATRTDILRLAAESEFSSELSDLAYDYAGAAADPAVLLVATPKKYVDWATALCSAAKLTCAAVSPSSIALADTLTTSNESGRSILTAGGTELIAPQPGKPLAIRTLRSATPGELRRARMSLPNAAGELLVFDSPGLATSLATGGVVARTGELAMLGLDISTVNGEATRVSTATALAASAIAGRVPSVDFLHSRLAAPQQPLVPRWAIFAAAAVVLGIIGTVLAFNSLAEQEAKVITDQAHVDSLKPQITAADAFVNMVTLARNWHSDNPRYVNLLRDFTTALPDDNQTFITGLQVRDVMQTLKGGRQVPTGTLTGSVYGKTSDQQRVQNLLDALKNVPTFSDVKPGGTQQSGRGREVTFSATFTFKPPATAPTAPAMTTPPGKSSSTSAASTPTNAPTPEGRS